MALLVTFPLLAHPGETLGLPSSVRGGQSPQTPLRGFRLDSANVDVIYIVRYPADKPEALVFSLAVSSYETRDSR